MLCQVVPERTRVFVKVRLMDLVSVPDKHWREFAPGSGMHLDFVLADAETLRPMLVIELDDRSHGRTDVQERDRFKNAALAAAELEILRVLAAGKYHRGQLEDKILTALSGR